MKDISKQIAAYEEILKVVKKYDNSVELNHNGLSVSRIEYTLSDLKLSARFGVEIKYPGQGSFHKEVRGGYDNWCGIGLYGSEGMEISFPDNGKQPKNEYLYKLSFGCGPYIFTDGYPSDNQCPRETFNAFFTELKTYNPAFVDTANKALYFRDDIAKLVHEEFPAIFRKYKALVDEELKQKRRAELQSELESLK